MREYLNTLLIASLTFFIGNFVGQALDRVIFRDNYNQNISYHVLSKDLQMIQSYWTVIDN